MKDEDEYTQDELDNHANQLNPNNDAYWESRGRDDRPNDWEEVTVPQGEEVEDEKKQDALHP